MASTNPTLPTLSQAEADNLQGTTDVGTGTPLIQSGHSPTDTPPVKTVLTQSEFHVRALLGGGDFASATNCPGVIGGLVVKVDTLTIGAFALKYLYSGTEESFLGESSRLLNANKTNYVYLDADATLKVSESAFPSPCYRLAKVTTGATDITAIENFAAHNYDPAGTQNWYNTAAAGDVDFAGNDLNNIGTLDLAAESELTVSSGSITPTQTLHTVDTESDAASDDLDAITAAAGERRILILSAANDARTVVVKDGTGNLNLNDGDFSLDNLKKYIVLQQTSDSGWHELCRNSTAFPATLSQNIDAEGYSLLDLGALAFRTFTVAIASGDADLSGESPPMVGLAKIENEVGSSDDLDTITGGQTGQFLMITPKNAPTQTLNVIHDEVGVTGGIYLNDDSDFEMDDARDFLLLFYFNSSWHEVARSKFGPSHLAGGYIKQQVTGFISGALSAGTQKWAWLPQHAGRFNKFSCYVKTAPSGGPCIVNVLKNGAAVYASEGNAVNIADGSSSDVSDQTSPVVTWNANDRIELSVSSSSSSPNGAADLTFTLDVEIAI